MMCGDCIYFGSNDGRVGKCVCPSGKMFDRYIDYLFYCDEFSYKKRKED